MELDEEWRMHFDGFEVRQAFAGSGLSPGRRRLQRYAENERLGSKSARGQRRIARGLNACAKPGAARTSAVSLSGFCFFFFLFSLSSFFLGYYPNRKLEIAGRRVRLCSLSSLLSRVRVREDEAARE